MVCRLCKHDTVEVLIDFGEQPIVHNLTKVPNEDCPRYPFQLGYCKTCGFMQVMECINPEVLYVNYFTISSWKNQPHVPRLINVMQSLTGISYSSRVLDVGCNDGSFLEALKKEGYKCVSGIEPTEDASRKAQEKGLNVHRGFFGKDLAEQVYGRASFDIVTTRQVLEHIAELDDFLEGINFVLEDDGCFIVEVPDSDWNLEYLDYALWEEHVNYFTLSTLRQLLAKHSFNIVHHETTLFSGRALIVFCEKARGLKRTVEFSEFRDSEKVHRFQYSWEVFKKDLHGFLAERKDEPIAIYGCGARSSNFVNFTGVAEYIDCFIDDQEEKQNMFVPGNNLEIVEWQEPKHEGYFFLLGVNTENEHKVIRRRALRQGSYCSVLPPSRHIPDFWRNMIHG